MSDSPVIINYLKSMNDKEASDIYLTVGQPPTIRAENEFVPLSPKPMMHEDIEEILNAILTNHQKQEFNASMELNTSLDMGKHGRYRVNVFRQKRNPAIVIRRITSTIPSFEDLRLPLVLEKLSLEQRGLILLTGMTGSGKSTTLAAMVDYCNQHRQGHIITIEDPVEYFHDHKKCVITQREVGVDTESYAVAMKNALRQRPDVILVGEVREREVMEQALVSAETGHLCMSTIHTNNSYQAIERITNFFPEEYGKQIRLNLASNLKAIISQRLVPAIGGGLVPAVEVMLNQGLVRELILAGEIDKIRDVIEQNVSSGMKTFDQSLLELLQKGFITQETAIINADKPSDLKVKIQNNSFESKGQSSKAGLQIADTPITLSD